MIIPRVRQLLCIEAIAALALLDAATLLGAFAYVDGLLSANAIFTPFVAARLVYLYSLVIGLPVVLLWGAPAYFGMRVVGGSSSKKAVALASGPAVAFALFLFASAEFGLAMHLLFSSVTVSLLTHFAYVKCRVRRSKCPADSEVHSVEAAHV